MKVDGSDGGKSMKLTMQLELPAQAHMTWTAKTLSPTLRPPPEICCMPAKLRLPIQSPKFSTYAKGELPQGTL